MASASSLVTCSLSGSVKAREAEKDQGHHHLHQAPHGKGPRPIHPTPSRFVGVNFWWPGQLSMHGDEYSVLEAAICLI